MRRPLWGEGQAVLPHSPERQSQRPSLESVGLVMSASAVSIVSFLPPMLVGALGPQLIRELGFGPARLGLAVSLYFLITALLAAPVGRLVDRIGVRAGMRLAMIVAALSLMGIALVVGSWPELALFLSLGGIANALASPSANVLLGQRLPVGTRAFGIGVKQASLAGAALLAGLSVPFASSTLGWQGPFLLASLAAAAGAFAIRAPVEPRGRSTVSGGKDWSFGALIPFAIAVGTGVAGTVGLSSFLTDSAVASGVTEAKAGLVLALGSLATIALRLFVGWITDRIKEDALWLATSMLGAGAVGFLILASGQPWALLPGALLAFGCGWGWSGVVMFLVVDNNHQNPAASTGILLLGGATGATCGPALLGFIVESHSYSAAWLAGALVSGVGTVVLFAASRSATRKMKGHDL